MNNLSDKGARRRWSTKYALFKAAGGLRYGGEQR